jgi:cation diffusion facilitator CzcD-associated flavoprotein CzcO
MLYWMIFMEKKRVLILGGGFGGVYTALEFEKRRGLGLRAHTLLSLAPESNSGGGKWLVFTTCAQSLSPYHLKTSL